jgi:hypothetical protein
MSTSTVRLHRVLRAPPERIYRAFRERSLATQAKILPDRLTKSGRKGAVRGVGEKTVLSDGFRAIELTSALLREDWDCRNPPSSTSRSSSPSTSRFSRSGSGSFRPGSKPRSTRGSGWCSLCSRNPARPARAGRRIA